MTSFEENVAIVEEAAIEKYLLWRDQPANYYLASVMK